MAQNIGSIFAKKENKAKVRSSYITYISHKYKIANLCTFWDICPQLFGQSENCRCGWSWSSDLMSDGLIVTGF